METIIKKIDALLPQKGVGFKTFNYGPDTHFGLAETIRLIKVVGLSWNGTPFAVGHISKRGGGKFPPHGSHQKGVDFDVRPLRRDKRNMPVTVFDSLYDSAQTENLIRLMWKLMPIKLILFNDKRLIKLGLCRLYKGHDNHFHVRLDEKFTVKQVTPSGSVTDFETGGANGE